MKAKNVLVLLLILIFSYKINAQDSDRVFMPKNTMLQKGKWALVFELGTIWGGNSSMFEAYALTAKKHLSDNLAVRLTFGFDMSKSSGKGNSDYPIYENKLTYNNDTKYYYIESSLNLQYYILKNDITKFFFSVGPYCHYSNSERYSSDTSKYEKWNAGLFGSVGTEVFLFKNISFIGEYILKATYGKSVQKDKMSGYNIYSDNENFDITMKTIRIGMSVYF